VTIHTADRVGDILKYVGPHDPVAARYAFYISRRRPDMPGPPTALLIVSPKAADAALAGGRDLFRFQAAPMDDIGASFHEIAQGSGAGANSHLDDWSKVVAARSIYSGSSSSKGARAHFRLEM
jgi:hypothetical protein